jgi:hypothetical protein
MNDSITWSRAVGRTDAITNDQPFCTCGYRKCIAVFYIS